MISYVSFKDKIKYDDLPNDESRDIARQIFVAEASKSYGLSVIEFLDNCPLFNKQPIFDEFRTFKKGYPKSGYPFFSVNVRVYNMLT